MNSVAGYETGESPVRFQCPCCGQPSTRIKSLRTGVLVFLGIAGFWRTWTVTGCPSCLRGKLLSYATLNLLTAHIIWPIAVLPWLTVQLLRTTLEGHSPAILQQFGLPVPPPVPLSVQFQQQLPVTFRVLGVVQILLGALLIAGLAFVLGDTWFHLRKLDLVIFQGVVVLAGTLIGYLAYSGLSKLLGLAPSLWNRLIVAVIVGAMLPLASPAIAKLTWISKEQEYFAAALGPNADDSETYVIRVPPEMWRSEPVARCVTHCISHLRGESAVWADSTLGSIRYDIEEYHAGNPEFASIQEQIRGALKE